MKFPAVFVGGPPHSGKSIFVYTLKRRLLQVEPRLALHHIRAAPDGEGDWSNEADPALVEQLRSKYAFTSEFAARMAEDIAGRQLPLLVDAGGLITTEQRRIADECTHAVVLSKDPERLTDWRTFVSECGLDIVAELHSTLDGKDRIIGAGSVLRATISGLERHTTKTESEVLHAVADRVKRLMTLTHTDAFVYHRASAPAAHVIDVQTIPPAAGAPWSPDMLPAVLAQLPSMEPVALYGRAPTWLYAAIAAADTTPACFPFDPRYGWVTPPALRYAGDTAGVMRATVDVRAEYAIIRVHLSSPHVRIEDVENGSVPEVPAGKGVILDGKLPTWLYVSLAHTYTTAPWLAVYYPPLHGAVVIMSDHHDYPVGAIVEIDYGR